MSTSPLPPQGTQQWRVLAALLAGKRLDPITAILDCNCFAVNARVSELRALGWPIRTLSVPHPNTAEFPDATLPCYLIDAHFREWIANNPGAHPFEYPDSDGRGKFAQEAGSSA